MAGYSVIDAAQLAKFKRRAPFIYSQAHLDKVMLLFPVEEHEAIATQIQPLLEPSRQLQARKVDIVPELKFQNPESPSLHETTVQRLNQMAGTIEQLKSDQKPLKDQIAELAAQLATAQATNAALITQRDQLQATVVEHEAHIQDLSALAEKHLTI